MVTLRGPVSFSFVFDCKCLLSVVKTTTCTFAMEKCNDSNHICIYKLLK